MYKNCLCKPLIKYFILCLKWGEVDRVYFPLLNTGILIPLSQKTRKWKKSSNAVFHVFDMSTFDFRIDCDISKYPRNWLSKLSAWFSRRITVKNISFILLWMVGILSLVGCIEDLRHLSGISAISRLGSRRYLWNSSGEAGNRTPDSLY